MKLYGMQAFIMQLVHIITMEDIMFQQIRNLEVIIIIQLIDMKYLTLFLSLTIGLLVTSCSYNHNKSSTSIKDIKMVFKKYDKSLPENFDLFVLTEEGCVSCNQSYLNFIVTSVVNRRNMYIYSAASGIQVDITPFLSDTISNLIEGNKRELSSLMGLDNSAFISVENGKIDTIIILKANDLRRSLEYIKQVD